MLNTKNTLRQYTASLESMLSRASQIENIIDMERGKERQEAIIGFVDGSNGDILGSTEYVKPTGATGSVIKESMLLMEFVVSSIMDGASKYLKGYEQRVSYNPNTNKIGITEFGNADGFEYVFEFYGYQDRNIELEIGTIDTLEKTFTVDSGYLLSIIENKEDYDDKQLKQAKGMIYALASGLEKELGYTSYLYILSQEPSESTVGYDYLEIDGLVEPVMLAYYDTEYEGVVKVEGNKLTKPLGNNQELNIRVVRDSEDGIYLTTWEIKGREGVLFDTLIENVDLYNIFHQG